MRAGAEGSRLACSLSLTLRPQRTDKIVIQSVAMNLLFSKYRIRGSYLALAFSGRNILAAIRVTARRGTNRCVCAPK